MENANVSLSILFQCLLYIAVFADDETFTTSRSSYFTTRENKRLEGHVVKRFNSPSLLSCSHQCARNTWCTSANFKLPSKENGQAGTCELNKHNISVVSSENTEFRDQQGVVFLMFLEGCHQFDSDGICVITGKSCRDIKRVHPHARDGMYRIQPDSGIKMFSAYCDMTSFGGGWTMCYSANNVVNPKVEVTYDEMLRYGTNGYRSDCNNIPVTVLILLSSCKMHAIILKFHALCSTRNTVWH
ncbi:angiopoietin-4-like [Orbicella faveolata]|uniref:angiopoietin-4-like n=1 Tax=Orbicella faveolata TaxID=48498 RepID=UPI0009E51C4D|nr:angiopoietin-4-like [Orbicella faveolata]